MDLVQVSSSLPQTKEVTLHHVNWGVVYPKVAINSWIKYHKVPPSIRSFPVPSTSIIVLWQSHPPKSPKNFHCNTGPDNCVVSRWNHGNFYGWTRGRWKCWPMRGEKRVFEFSGQSVQNENCSKSQDNVLCLSHYLLQQCFTFTHLQQRMSVCSLGTR